MSAPIRARGRVPGPLQRPSRAARIALLGVAVAVSGLSCGPCSPGRTPDSERPNNVVLAVLDTVRADHISCYGYSHPTTPAIDALAAEGVRYEVARSTSSWTLPSHASMLTGLYPFHHGAQARKDPRTGEIVELPLRERGADGVRIPTLAEALGSVGYQSFGVVANGGYLGTRFGFARGFDVYDEKPPNEARRGPEVNRIALELLAERDRARPFFLFLNYMDAHRPYNVRPLPPERAASLPAPDPENPSQLLTELVMAVLESDEPLDPSLRARVVTQYDYGIAHADLALERLVEWLKDEGEWERTLFVVTADHGEFLGEHDLAEHSKDVYEEGLRVPLVVRHPGRREGRVVHEPISVVQIPCLVIDALPAGPRASLADTFGCMPEGGVNYAELRYTRGKDLRADYGHRFDRERTVLYEGGLKLILSSDGHHELYDLEADPAEATNLFRQDDELSERLLARIAGVRSAADRGEVSIEAPERTPEEIEELRRLGYLGDSEE